MCAWLYAPEERRALGDVAKLAAALRSGAIAGGFLDGEAVDVALGTVGRVTLLAPADLGLSSEKDRARRFVLARGTDRYCLAEVVAGEADRTIAQRLVDAGRTLAAQPGARPVCVWLVAERVSDEARTLLAEANGVATSTGT
jgi:hypothetical protein